MSSPEASGVLRGLRVVEIGSFIAGPFCGQMLADHGAEVIKIEPPGTGDSMRNWGAVQVDGKSLWWPVIARNKLSITLDLRTDDGIAILRRLLSEADVLVENFRPGTLEKWGLSPDRLHADHPGLIIARVSGFGQSGPNAGRAGFGAIAEAAAGMRNLTGYDDRPPSRIGLSIGDSLAGLFALIGILLSLHHRNATGKGQVVDVAIADAVLAVMESVLAEHGATGSLRRRSGATLPGIAPSNLYPTADGKSILIAGNADTVFARLAEAMGRPGLASDARFATHRERGKHQSEIDALVAEWTSTLALSELLSRLEEHGVPAGTVATEADVVTDLHFRERESVVKVESEDFGRLVMQGVMPKLSSTPGAIRWPGQRLGEATDLVLSEHARCSAAELQNLRKTGVI